ncbi:MAG: hypothetical protein ACRDPW_07570, partial [Mycobacteriales bacterium]
MGSQRALRVAVLGCGTVGSEAVRLLYSQAAELAERVGAPLELVGIAVRDASRHRPELPVASSMFTTDAMELATRDDVDIVVELIGEVKPPRTTTRPGNRAAPL